ncbi:MAG: hypothetical protein IPL40_14160 [Proteobacteria bacterium]|nr:hypothetical protein [Pseudomonadota bacterium]
MRPPTELQQGRATQRTDAPSACRQRSRAWRRRSRHTALFLLGRGVLALWGRLPARCALVVGRAIGRLACALAATERRRALAQLEAAGLGASAQERRQVVRQMFARLGESLAQCLLRLRWGAEAQAAPALGLTPRARAVLADGLAAGRGIVLVGGHLGNWELVGAALARVVPLQVLARSSYDPRWTRLIERWRQAAGVGTIWVDRPGALRRALTLLRAGGAVALLIDQPLRRGGCLVPFFGRLAPTSTLAAALAQATGAALLVAWPLAPADAALGAPSRPSATTEIDVFAEISALELERGRGALPQAMARLTGALEARVRADPASWLWSLDRWRRKA